MYIGNLGNRAVFLLGLLLTAGCTKSESAGSARPGTGSEGPIAAIHWLGIGRLSAQTNAAAFLNTWRLPETDKLKGQTLDKLALAPWRSNTNRSVDATNYSTLLRGNRAANLLRQLLDDVVQEESYLEIQEAGASAAQMAFAVRLSPARAAVWETNLAAIFESVAGAHRRASEPADGYVGWQIVAANPSGAIPAMFRHTELGRTGEWTIFGAAPGENRVFKDLVGRIGRKSPPFSSPSRNWLETAVDLRRLSQAMSWGWSLDPNWPRISLELSGDGQNVVTHGRFDFHKPLSIKPEPWKVPNSLIHEPLHSFTAVQGLGPWLSSLPIWRDSHASEAPNQVFCWAQSGTPFLAYAAAPVANANTVLSKIGPEIMDRFNPELATNRMGRWEHDPIGNGLLWTHVPILSPFVRPTKTTDSQFLFAGLTGAIITNTTAPTVTLQALTSDPALVYFQHEITGPRVEAWTYLSQLFRIILRRVQLPGDGYGLAWLKASAPLLGSSKTTVAMKSPALLALERTSTLGLTAMELHLLIDWLESPQFPGKPYSMVSKLPPLPPRRSGTNQPPVRAQ
jgi:hypothetical protein